MHFNLSCSGELVLYFSLLPSLCDDLSTLSYILLFVYWLSGVSMFIKWDYINQKCECHLGGSGKKKNYKAMQLKRKM